MNYWKQLSQLMKYFRAEEDPSAKLPKNFMSGFMEVCSGIFSCCLTQSSSLD